MAKLEWTPSYFTICDITCQNQTYVGICHLPEIKF